MTVRFILLSLVLLMLELVYFHIAIKFRIFDKPNERSSHVSPTIRGGGIIFFVAALIWFIYQDFRWPWFMAGMLSVAIISFLDDLKSHAAFWRFIIHLIAVTMMFYQVPIFDWPWWLAAMALVVCIGSLSAFNFMDGINGITGIYALVSLGSFAWINFYNIAFTDGTLIFALISAVLVFLFFNFRKQAVCFAGDVGSITLAFVQIFFLLQLIHKTNNFYWVLIFLVFGLDTVITIIYRLKRKENIFKAHRTHLYQYLSNELKCPHRIVSLVYGGTQLAINGIICYDIPRNNYLRPLAAAILFSVVYLWIREGVVRKIEKIGR